MCLELHWSRDPFFICKESNILKSMQNVVSFVKLKKTNNPITLLKIQLAESYLN